MATNALKKITTRAKQIRKKQPGKSWKSAVKEASREYQAGKKAPAKKRRVSGVAKPKPRVGGKIKSIGNTSTGGARGNRTSTGGARTSTTGNRTSTGGAHTTNIRVGAIRYKGGSVTLAGVGTVDRQKAELRHTLGQQAGWLDVAISSAKTKREKNALRKKKREVIADLNRIK